MMEMLEDFFDRIMTIGIAICGMVALIAIPGVDFLQSYKKLNEENTIQAVTIAHLQSEIQDIHSVINNHAGVSTFDVSSAINSLKKNIDDVEERNVEILSILRDDPDTLATIREVNVKYDHILKQLEKVESDIARTEDKVFSGSQTQLTIWVAIAIFLIGAIPSFILGHRRKTEQSS
ncbi:hypothetical protein [Alteromonas stellipolaris]|uniref:hypothetical protein n=1 Tax=Alteromonas stellipolaris TaxID=233316 RepID=UPI0026E21230|nr:hypothetical protein [Alteromonas stellipolaris]MDO6536930.1 hypothetical protein [Alteromonas stellipolaris]MDO6628291.1 hypothetical protein [Alteromonas stellipolaris]